jgi:hypothetical protein
MIRLLNLHKNNSLPRVLFYIIQLENRRERFIKIGVSGFLHTTIKGFESFGFRVSIVCTVQFSCNEHAINEIKMLADQYKNVKYIPYYNFPENDNCYGIELLDGLNLQEFAEPIANEISHEISDKIITDLLASGMNGREVASKLNISESKVSRIKKKLGL